MGRPLFVISTSSSDKYMALLIQSRWKYPANIAHSNMADSLIGLDDVHFDDLNNEPSWALFEMDLMEEDFPTVDVTAGDSVPRQFGAPTTATGAVSEVTPGCGSALGSDMEWRRSNANAPLDMNDPTVLNDYASLLLFANNPSAHHLDLEGCDSSKQATIRALAVKLDLQYSYDASTSTIRLQKESYRKDFGQPEPHLSKIQRPAPPFGYQISSPSAQWKSSHVAESQCDNYLNANRPSPFLHADAVMDFDTASSELNSGNPDTWGEIGYFSLATPQYQGLSDDDQDSSQISSRPPVPIRRRSSWLGLSRALKEVGACWRCKILRKKCDPHQPCKACPRSGTHTSRWQTIGCKRGTLLDHTPYVSLCPKASALGLAAVNNAFDAAQQVSRTSGVDKVELCLQDASTRLDGICASENDTYTKIVLEILCSPIAITTDIPLSLRHDVVGNVIHITWGLIDVASTREILHIKSVEQTLDVLKAAVAYETEYGQSQAVPIAIKCFRNCIEILRLHDSGHLMPKLHDECVANKCQIQPFQELSSSVKSFTDELSKVIFRKENRLHEKRWWLSTFYSLWIQSLVRRTIRFIETQAIVQLSPEIRHACSSYPLLALELFEAASASFDPLVSAWSLDDEPPNMDLRLMKYYRLAQKALSGQWASGAGSSIDFLRCLYQDSGTSPNTHIREDLPPSSVSNLINDDSESHGHIKPRPPIFQTHKLTQAGNKFSVPVRTRSGAKRRAGSPLQDVGFIRRNGSSSSMLDSRDLRSRALSIASPASPMSPAYSFAYGTSSSTRWNGSGDSLAEMSKLLGTSPPNPRDQYDYLNPSKGHRPSLHYKSSNESFLELPRTLNKRRPASSPANDGLRGLFLCECCPKKPKKFETMEELRAHEAEKQYQCSFCGKRFKSKNEAERHQNSLHVRRHAWSCSNILSIGYKNLFQESINQPGMADTCGYCGEDFPRNGGGTNRQATDKDWDDRLSHVRETHKFGECNSSKKFYRADHFRQHLKHSHAATLGRWMNALEGVCMIDLPILEDLGKGPDG
ncbi:hypothetical protein F5Y13DRAFT_198908 [Hypoxylon sp. FL1857]|nr:hypothetical protein F5Y13DRAFT_198908 [Hypoxylon sp. FL1857]